MKKGIGFAIGGIIILVVIFVSFTLMQKIDSQKAQNIALKQAGFTNVKVYVGSYSDWVSYEENPVKTTL